MHRCFKPLIVVLVLLLAGVAVAKDIAPYAFGYLACPDGKNDQYRFAWLRVGAHYTADTDLPGTLKVRTEFDITRDSFDGAFKYGYVEWTGPIESLDNISLIAGQFLGPVHYVWPGPQQTRVKDMPDAQNFIPLYNRGVQVRWHGPVDVRIAHVNNGTGDDTAFTGWVNWQGLQAYFVQDLAWGCAFTRSQCWWLNGTVGVTHDDDADIDRFWLEYYIEHRGVRLSAVLEMPDFEDEVLDVTLDIPYARFSSLRTSYTTDDDTFRGGVSFSY